jgi:hypothetical protein
MTEPWFDPNLYAWIPGTALGIAGGVLGSLGGVLAPRGRARGVVLGLYGAVLCVTRCSADGWPVRTIPGAALWCLVWTNVARSAGDRRVRGAPACDTQTLS